MDQDATWYEGRPWPGPHCVTWGPSSPPKRGPIFGPRLLSPNGHPSQLLLSSGLNIVMLCVMLCFNAYVVNKFHDDEHCSCSDWAVCDIRRGRFAIHCFGTMLQVEGLEKRLGLGLARSRSRLVAKIRRLSLVSWNCRKVLVSVSSRTKNRMSRSRKLRSHLHPSFFPKSNSNGVKPVLSCGVSYSKHQRCNISWPVIWSFWHHFLQQILKSYSYSHIAHFPLHGTDLSPQVRTMQWEMGYVRIWIRLKNLLKKVVSERLITAGITPASSLMWAEILYPNESCLVSPHDWTLPARVLPHYWMICLWVVYIQEIVCTYQRLLRSICYHQMVDWVAQSNQYKRLRMGYQLLVMNPVMPSQQCLYNMACRFSQLLLEIFPQLSTIMGIHNSWVPVICSASIEDHLTTHGRTCVSHDLDLVTINTSNTTRCLSGTNAL